MEDGARTRIATALILAVVFTSGVLLGLAADRGLWAEPPDSSFIVEPPLVEDGEEAEEESAEESGAERRYIYHQVEPNEEQLARIETIVAEWRARREAYDDESRARWEAGRRELTLETRNAIKAVLSPEQAAEYQRLIEEWEAEREAEREK